VERRSDLRELVEDIGRLPEDQRAALVMSEIEELGHAEVAEVLGCPRDKVRALAYQARSSLAGWREARALHCRDVRQELAIARGGALRRGHLRLRPQRPRLKPLPSRTPRSRTRARFRALR
jgi:Sigma-70, region 4